MNINKALSGLLLVQLVVLGLSLLNIIMGFAESTSTIISSVLFTVFVIVTFLLFATLVLKRRWSGSEFYVFGVLVIYVIYAIGLYLIEQYSSTATIATMVMTITGLIVVPTRRRRNALTALKAEEDKILDEIGSLKKDLGSLKHEDDVLVASKNGNKIHRPSCMVAGRIDKEDRVSYDTFNDAVKAGYIACKLCAPDKK